jgi:hypothetical protein
VIVSNQIIEVHEPNMAAPSYLNNNTLTRMKQNAFMRPTKQSAKLMQIEGPVRLSIYKEMIIVQLQVVKHGQEQLRD